MGPGAKGPGYFVICLLGREPGPWLVLVQARQAPAPSGVSARTWLGKDRAGIQVYMKTARIGALFFLCARRTRRAA